MRFFLVIVVWLVCVGGMYCYTEYRAGQRVENPIVPVTIKEPQKLQKDLRYSLSIIPTFSQAEDPFGLQIEGEDTGLDILIGLNGEYLEHNFSKLERGVEAIIPDITGLHLGLNEIYIQLSPPIEDMALHNGLLLCVKVGDEVLFEAFTRAMPGEMISDFFTFVIEEQAENASDEGEQNDDASHKDHDGEA